MLIRRRKPRARGKRRHPLAQRACAQIRGRALCWGRACALFDCGDRSHDRCARGVGGGLLALHAVIDRGDRLLDLEQLAARGGAVGLKLGDARIGFAQLAEIDEAIGGGRNLRHAELEIARAEHQRAQRQNGDHRQRQHHPNRELVKRHGLPLPAVRRAFCAGGD
ncbi:MAG: hypothetical protein NVV62_14795 [Terricaulis sp.]|nr:hypothetical protein [Terricaulis sp.]